MKVVVASFNQEKALVGAFSVITNLRMEVFEALVQSRVLGFRNVLVTELYRHLITDGASKCHQELFMP